MAASQKVLTTTQSIAVLYFMGPLNGFANNIVFLTASRVVATKAVQENDNGSEVTSAGALNEYPYVSDDEWILNGF